MKVKIETQESKFKVRDLIITIESQRELEFLWALFNANDNDLIDFANKYTTNVVKKFEEVPINNNAIWSAIKL